MQPFLHIAAGIDNSRKGEWKTSFSLVLKTALKLSFMLALGLFWTTETSAATVTNRVTGAANWNAAATWIANRSGTVTFTNGSKNVTGVGTAFLSELSVGDVLMLQASPGTVRGTIASITNNTQLVLVANASATASGAYGRQQVPVATDDVVIGNANLATPAVTITLNVASATVNSLTFTATTVANALTHSGTNALTVSNNVAVNQPTSAVTVAWKINGGSGTVNGNVTIGGTTTTASQIARIAVTGGSLSVAGAVNYAANATAANEVITVSTGSVSFSNALTLSSGTLSVTSTGTINLNGGLSFGSANTPSFSTVANSNINFGGGLTATTTALTFIATSNATFTGNATITPTSAITFGRLKVNSGVTATLAGNTTVAGNLTVDGTLAGAFTTTLSVSATTVAGNNGTIAGSITTAVAHSVVTGTGLTVQSDFAITAAVTVTNNGSVTIQGNLTGSAAGSTWVNAANSSLTAVGTVLTIGTLTASANPNTVTYNSTTAAQTVKGTTYHDLVINKSGQTGTLGAATTVNDDLTVTAGTLSTAALTLGVAGNFVVNGTLSGTGAITLSGAGKNIDGTGSITNTATTTINAAHTVLATANLSFSGTIAISGAVTVTNNGTITTSAAGGITGTLGSSTWTNAANSTLNIAGPLLATGTLDASANPNTVNFNGTIAQTIPAFNYHHLTSSSSGARTLAGSGTVGVAGTFTPGTNSYTIAGSTIDFRGASTQTIPVFNYNNLTSSSTGARTLAGSGTIGIAGTFTPGTNSYTITGSTIDFKGAGAQTIPAFTYNNLTSSSTGARTLASSSTIGIAGTLTPGTNAYTITGSTIDFNGAGAQTIPAFTYNNLTSSSSGARTLAGSGTVGIAGAFTPGTNSYTITGSTIDFNGAGVQTIPAFNYNNLTSSSTGARTLAGSGTIGIAATFTPGTNSYTITGSTIDFNGAGVQTIPAFNYNNLTSSSSGARTLTGSGTVGIAGAFTPGTNSYTITGSTIDFNGAGAQTIPAFTYNNLTGSSSGARTLAGSGTVGIAGTFTPGSNSYTITGSTINFNGAGAQTIPAFDYNSLTISGSRTANNVTLASSGTIGIAEALLDTATFNAGNGVVTTGSTVRYNGTGSQTVTALSPLVGGNSTYNNLTISNSSSAISASTSFSVGGNLTLDATTTFAPGSSVVISGAGTLTGGGTAQVTRATGATDFTGQYTITNKTLANLTVEFDGASAQGNGANTFGGLKINNSNGVSLSGDSTVSGILTLVSGNISTGANKVIISSTGSVSRTSGHVFGNLQKNVAVGATLLTFEVGDATNYTPVDVSFASVTSAGNLIVSTTSGDHPNIATSLILSSKSVNRYWRLTNSGIVFTTYSATFNFVAGDVDGGANTGAFIVGRFTSGTWSYPIVGTKTATSTQATGLSAFGDFQLGEAGLPSIDLVKSVNPSNPQPPDTDIAYSITFTNSGSGTGQSLIIIDPNPNDVDTSQRVFVNVDYKLGSVSISSPWSATIEFSNDGGSTWSYAPVSAGGGAPAGYDRAVTNIRCSINGNVAPSATGTFSFTVRIR